MEALPVLVTERNAVFRKTIHIGIQKMDLEAHVDPHFSVRSNHFSTITPALVFPKKFCITSTAHVHVRNSFVLSFVKVFGFWRGYEGKILKKFLSVPLIEIYRSSYLTFNSVH